MYDTCINNGNTTLLLIYIVQKKISHCHIAMRNPYNQFGFNISVYHQIAITALFYSNFKGSEPIYSYSLGLVQSHR